MQSQPPPKGSLEELFRHHLLESEAAAVPPRPLVWDHIDNSLLLAQNEKYRRRLLVHRWGMAASLLLATLAGGGWWHSQQVAMATLASAHAQSDAARLAVTGAATSRTGITNTANGVLADNYTSTSASTQRLASGAAAGGTTEQATDNRINGLAGNQSNTIAANTLTAIGSRSLGRAGQAGHRTESTWSGAAKMAGHGAIERNQADATAGTVAYATTGQRADGTGQAAGTALARTFTFPSTNPNAIAATTTSSSVRSTGALSAVGQPTTEDEAAQEEGTYAQNERAARLTDEALLDPRLAKLALASATLPPAELAMKELPQPTTTLLRRWRYGAEYAITAFQPNIDFNRSSSDYNPALGLNTVSLTRAAAAEYRANLKPGLGQRLTLRATRWMGGHWSVGTGIEVAQQDAYSATSAAFTGEQLADLASSSPSTGTGNYNASAPRDLHGSSFRYRSAGIPLELQYDNQAKSGVSFYGRVGAIVSALLNVRSEVAGNPEATRTYSFNSASTPYRRLTALLRGSAGVRYRPAGRGWGLNVGPTAEMGVQSLNSETDRNFLQQSRPYSVGIEAGIEFGGSLKPVPTSN